MNQASASLLHRAGKAEQASGTVAILLSTYNGERYLAEQLDSLISQTYGNWIIHASDDGSQDATLSILQRYQRQLGEGRLVLHQGPARGFSANFLSLVRAAGVQASYYAFCDQDDIWAPEKLERGLAWISSRPTEKPLLHCSRTRLIDEAGKPIGLSPLFKAPLSFENALVQSIAGGNTMLFNEETRKLLATTRESSHIVSHDWWSYILVTGCGGEVCYDPEPTLNYRQHSQNLIGSNISIRGRLQRLRRLLKGTFKEWNEANLAALAPPVRNHLTPHSLEILELFAQARTAPLLQRLRLVRKAGIYRQTFQGNLGLFIATLFQRF